MIVALDGLARMGMHSWIKIGAVAAGAAVLVTGLGPLKGIPLAIVGGAMLLQREIGTLLVNVLPWIHYRARRSVLLPWHGRYFSYDNRHVRFYQADGQIWVAVEDVLPFLVPAVEARELRALGADYGPIPGEGLAGLTEAGITQLVTRRSQHHRADPRLIHFRNWLLRETLPNIHRLGL